MATICAEKSQKILDTLRLNIESFRKMLEKVDDELIQQNILRSMILFSCSGIDAIVKQLVLETLEPVIERDRGAQEQLRKYVERKLKSNSGINTSLLAELFTARNSRKMLIELLKKDLSYDSLQSPEQLYRVASYFNISTSKLVDKEKEALLKQAFRTRNIVVHQMDVDFMKPTIVCYEHDIDEVNEIVNGIDVVAKNFIYEVNDITKRVVSPDSSPYFSEEDLLSVLREI